MEKWHSGSEITGTTCSEIIGTISAKRLALFRPFYAIRENIEKICQPPHPLLGTSYSNLAQIEKALGNYTAAKELTMKAIKNIEIIHQSPHPILGTTYSNLARIEQALGNYTAAEHWLLKAIEENDIKIYQQPYPLLGMRFYYLAQIEYALGDTEAACKCMRFSYKNYQGHFGEDHPHTKAVEGWLQNWGC